MKNKLGRGIGNFLNDFDKSEIFTDSKDLVEINLDEIITNPDQPRKNFDDESIKELSKSILEHGLIQPVIVSKRDDGYKLIAGERRFRAAKLAKLKKISAIIKDLDELEEESLSIVENIQRLDLNPIEEARSYKRLIDRYDLKQEDLSKKLGKSRQYIGNTMRLLKLEPEVIEMIENNLLSASHGKVLLGIKDPKEQLKRARQIVNKKSTVRAAQKSINSKEDIYTRDLVENLIDYLGTKVILKPKKKGGRLEIEYYSDEELERIVEKISGEIL